jgi:conjugative transfer signal peptidase TraF
MRNISLCNKFRQKLRDTDMFMVSVVVAILAIICMTLSISCRIAAKSGYRVNTTGSMPMGLYRLAPGLLKRGDIVEYCLEGKYARLARERGYLGDGLCPNGLTPLLKRVAGVAGDEVLPETLGILATDSKGRPMRSALDSGIIPEGKALLLGESPGSFDGRYFGLVPIYRLQRVEQVWTW